MLKISKMTINTIKNSRILVTGGGGFVGSNLCLKLLELNNQVTCIDNLTSGSLENIEEFSENKEFKFINADVNNHNQMKIIFEEDKFDYVFHYAAIVGVKKTLENPLQVLNDINGIKNILEFSRKYDIKKVLFSSSSEVYGEPVEIPERENGVTNGKLPYAVVKLIGENYMNAYHSTHGLRTTSLRFFNVYGPKQISSAYGFVVGIFINQVLNGESPTIFGDGKQTRDFTFIGDNINASILTMEKKSTDGEVINMGTGKSITILELAESVIKAAGKEGAIKSVFLKSRPNDIKHRCPSIDKMKELIGYKIKTDLNEGLRETIEWYKEKLKNV